MSEMRLWLSARIKELPGKSKAGLARALGVAPARVHEIISGKRAIDATEVEPMARYLDWTVNELLEAIRLNNMPELGFMVPQIGSIISGAEVYDSEHLMTGAVPILVKRPEMIEDGEDSLVALLVDTDELEPRYYRGEHVFFTRVGKSDWDQLLGIECVVRRSDGSMAVRVIQRNSDGRLLLLVPFRNLVESDSVIEWASPVKYVTRQIRPLAR